jgi:hypothetical protein
MGAGRGLGTQSVPGPNPDHHTKIPPRIAGKGVGGEHVSKMYLSKAKKEAFGGPGPSWMSRRVWRVCSPAIRCMLLAGALLGLLACQGADRTQNKEQPAPSPPVAVTKAATIESPSIPTSQIEPAGLTGQVVAESDVAGQPDTALPKQMVLAIPAASAAEILGIDSQMLGDAKLRFLKAHLSQADPAISIALSDAVGKYSLFLTPGEYVLCVADAENMAPSFPATTRGCGRTSVPPGKLRQVDISSGFGEIVLIERPV